MLSLRELQEAFVGAVLGGCAAPLEASIAGDLPASERIAIYANNARENLIATLAAAFPVVRALGGEDWFRHCARSYWQAHPSRAGNLHYVGVNFPAYLHTQLASTPHAYFAAVARLEWAYQEALVAADHPGFDLAALAHVAADDHADLHFALHPAARLVASDYPVLDIWSAHQADAGAMDAIDLSRPGQRVLLIRRSDHVQLRALPSASWNLLRGLADGASLGASAEAALAADPDFDLATMLAQLVALGVLVDFSTSSFH